VQRIETTRRMSLMGQIRTSSDLDVMSAVLLITDSTRTSFNVAEGPEPDIRSFQYLLKQFLTATQCFSIY